MHRSIGIPNTTLYDCAPLIAFLTWLTLKYMTVTLTVLQAVLKARSVSLIYLFGGREGSSTSVVEVAVRWVSGDDDDGLSSISYILSQYTHLLSSVSV
jgi:hypothetical protein